MLEEGFEVILKLHTKKSKHRQDGDIWRNDIFEKLVSSVNVERAVNMLCDHKEIGMIGPEDHIIPMTTYWGRNEKSVLDFAARMGIDREQVMSGAFVAGTMFYARVSALQPLLNLAISDADFEEEAGQVDGTLAHSLERTFAISLTAANQQLVSTEYYKCKDGDMVTKTYSFAPSPKR